MPYTQSSQQLTGAPQSQPNMYFGNSDNGISSHNTQYTTSLNSLNSDSKSDAQKF
jgi:hypothetical protein